MDLSGAAPARPAPAPEASVPARGARSVAVLPFRNGGPPEDAYLAGGLTEEVIDGLAMTAGLRVRPLGAVARFAGTDLDPQQIGRQLEVDVVVDGSLRRAGEVLRISARASSVADGFQLWAKRFESTPGNLLQTSDEVAGAIAAALTVRLAAPARKGSHDEVAADLHLRARHAMRERFNVGLLPAIALFEAALARAPDDASILAGLALSLARESFAQQGESRAMLVRAVTTANRAVQADPANGEAWVALAVTSQDHGDVPGAARALREALVRSPGLARPQQLLGTILAEVGPMDEAIRRLEAALELDPTNLQPRFELARCYALLGDNARMSALFALPVPDPSSAFAHNLYLFRIGVIWGRDLSLLHRVNVDPPAPGDHFAIRYVRDGCAMLRGEPGAADALETLLADAQQRYEARLHNYVCQVHAELRAYLGDVPGTIAPIREGATTGLRDALWIDGCPLFAEARQHPDWAAARAGVLANAAAVRATLDAP